MRNIRKTLADNLVFLRELRGLTQEALAERAGVSIRGVQNIEYQERWPAPETIAALAHALEVPETQLFQEEEIQTVLVEPSFENAANIFATRLQLMSELCENHKLRIAKLEMIVQGIAKSMQSERE